MVADGGSKGEPPGAAVGLLLVEAGLIDEATFEDALLLCNVNGGRLDDRLVRMGAVRSGEIADCLATTLDLVRLHIVPGIVDPAAVALLPAAFCRAARVVALRRGRTSLVMAMADPFDVVALEEAGRLTGLDIDVMIAEAAAIESILLRVGSAEEAFEESFDDAYDHGSRAEPVPADLFPGATSKVVLDLTDDFDGTHPAVAALLDRILSEAATERVRSIHIDPAEGRIRFRSGGRTGLAPSQNVPRRVYGAIIARLAILAGLDGLEQVMPQCGYYETELGSESRRVWVNILPTILGRKAVVHLVGTRLSLRRLDELGLGSKGLRVLTGALSGPGIVLVTGPTGSGKTTTQYAALGALAEERRDIATCEWVVQAALSGVTQVQVQPASGWGFAPWIRRHLANGAEVIGVGELSFLAGWRAAIDAARAGCTVLAVMHTRSGADALSRQVDNGVPSSDLAETTRLVLNQRLLRTLCPGCREVYVPDEAVRDYFGLPTHVERLARHRPGGCATCDGEGFAGRTAAFEILSDTKAAMAAIEDGASLAGIDVAVRAAGCRSLREAALERAFALETSLEEIARVTPCDRMNSPQVGGAKKG